MGPARGIARISAALAAGAVALWSTACGGDHGATQPTSPPPAVPVGKPPSSAVPAHRVGGFQVEIPPTTLEPGDDVSPCFIVPLTLDGPSRVVGGGSVEVGQGMHHGSVVAREKTGEGARACEPGDAALGAEGNDMLAGSAVLYSATGASDKALWQSFPDGMGYRLPDGVELVARMHYINPTSAPLTIVPSYEFATVDEASVETELTPFTWSITKLSIPPNAETTVSASCAPPKGLHVVDLVPHMHTRAHAMDADFVGGALDGTTFLTAEGYDAQVGATSQYVPALDLALATAIRLDCTWSNSTPKTLTEGVGDDEMCIVFGYGYELGGAAASGGTCTPSAP